MWVIHLDTKPFADLVKFSLKNRYSYKRVFISHTTWTYRPHGTRSAVAKHLWTILWLPHPVPSACIPAPWWRHQMETFSVLLALCAGKSLVTCEFPSQRPVTWSFDIFFDLCLVKRLSKHSRRRWIETPSRSLRRHCKDVCRIYCALSLRHTFYKSPKENSTQSKFDNEFICCRGGKVNMVYIIIRVKSKYEWRYNCNCSQRIFLYSPLW